MYIYTYAYPQLVPIPSPTRPHPAPAEKCKLSFYEPIYLFYGIGKSRSVDYSVMSQFAQFYAVRP